MVAADAVLVARVEIADIDSADDRLRRLAVATLRQAVDEMWLADPVEVCPRITHVNGQLVARYWAVG